MSSLAEPAVPAGRTPPPRPLPWLARPEVQRVFYPALVAVLLLGLWQWWVTAFEIPKFLVPSPGWWRKRWSPMPGCCSVHCS